MTIRLCLLWDDGVVSHSQHANGRLVARYLLHLHRRGEHVRILALI